MISKPTVDLAGNEGKERSSSFRRAIELKFDLVVRDIFRLANGLTVLAFEGGASVESLEGNKCLLVNDGQVRQKIAIAREHFMLNKKSHHRALETNDSVDLTSEEAQSGYWRLVCEG